MYSLLEMVKYFFVFDLYKGNFYICKVDFYRPVVYNIIAEERTFVINVVNLFSLCWNAYQTLYNTVTTLCDLVIKYYIRVSQFKLSYGHCNMWSIIKL